MPALLLTALTALARLHEGTWFAPGPFFALIWTLLIWLPMILLPGLPPYPPAVAWITASCATVVVGGHFGARLHSPEPAGAAPEWRFLNQLLIATGGVGLAIVVLLLRAKGYSPLALFSLHDLQQLGSEYSTDRYRHSSEPIGPRILIPTVYLGGLLAGLRLATRKGRWHVLLAALPLLPATLIAIVEATRAALLFPLVLGLSSFLATRVAVSRGGDGLFSWRRLWLTVAGVAGLLAVSLAVLALRYESVQTHANLPDLFTRIRLDSFGYLAVWSVWFSHGGWTATQHPALGYYTFSGLFDLLHLKARVPGVYTDAVNFGGPHGTSNIFTIYRGLIQDFTGAGSMVLLAAAGGVAGFALAAARRGRVAWTPVLAAFYSMTLWSFIVDIFSYNTILLAWLLYLGYVVAATRLAADRVAAVAGNKAVLER